MAFMETEAAEAPQTSRTDINRRKLEELARLGWYHTMELPDGQVIPGFHTLDVLRNRLAQFPVPADLHGKRVLDIGAWDGWFTFELERRGAQVMAVDSTPFEGFRIARDLFGSQAEYRIDDVCRLSPAKTGYFDIVMFLGVLYHLKHPMLAFERVCELATDMVCVESFVTDDGSDPAGKPVMEFYETTELCGQFDNWVGPNTACLLAMCRSAGFARVQLESVLDHRAHVTCYRRWPEIEARATRRLILFQLKTPPRATANSPSERRLRGDLVQKPAHRSHPGRRVPARRTYGSHPVFLQNIGGDGWQVNCKLPPGLAPGWMPRPCAQRIAVGKSCAHRRRSFRRTAPPAASGTGSRQYPHRHRDGRQDLGTQPGPRRSAKLYLAVGLRIAEEADRDDVTVWLDGDDLPAVFLSEPDPQGLRQINAMLPSGAQPGEYSVSLGFGGAVSAPVAVRLV